MCKLLKFKAKARLKVWQHIRQRREVKEKEKAEIRQKLLERYDIPESEQLFLNSRSDRHWWSYKDENGHTINMETGDFIPLLRRGDDLVFFYEVVKTWRKYGDYGYSDYGYFAEVKYSHHEKIPLVQVDYSKSLKITWEKIDKKDQKGFVQGVHVFNISTHARHRGYNPTEIEFVLSNFSDYRIARKYGGYKSRYDSITETKKVCDQIMKDCRDCDTADIEIREFYIPHKKARKNL